jgi:hypothetical protein
LLGTRSALIYFSHELLATTAQTSVQVPAAWRFGRTRLDRDDDSDLRQLIPLAELLASSPELNAQLVVVMRNAFSSMATAFAATFSPFVSLLADPDAIAGRLYGCHCLEQYLDDKVSYDRAPLMCLVDRLGLIRLVVEEPCIVGEDQPSQWAAAELQERVLNYWSGQGPQRVPESLLRQLLE